MTNSNQSNATPSSQKAKRPERSEKKKNYTPRHNQNQNQELPGKRFRNVILIGMPGAGKSSVGKTYAYHTKRNFIDLDRLIENYFGKSIPQIFSEDGEDAFRQAETKCLRKISRYYNCVVAVGGGTVADTNNFNVIRQMGFVVYLDSPTSILSSRLYRERDTKPRPLLSGLKDEVQMAEKLEELLAARLSHFEQADHIIKTGFSSVDASALELLTAESKAFHREYQRLVAAVGKQPPLMVYPQGHHWMIKRFSPKRDTPKAEEETLPESTGE